MRGLSDLRGSAGVVTVSACICLMLMIMMLLGCRGIVNEGLAAASDPGEEDEPGDQAGPGTGNITGDLDISAGKELPEDYEKQGLMDEDTGKDDEVIDQDRGESMADDIDDNWEEKQKPKELVMFHNGNGPMCIEQLEFLDSLEKCPELKIREHLTTDEETFGLLQEMKVGHSRSKGVSASFSYLPITFVNGNAYSGFDSAVEEMLRKDIEELCG